MPTASLEKKPRKKRQSANYYVVIGDNALECFKTHRSAVRFIKEKLDPASHGLQENDVIKVVKQIEKIVSTHTFKPVLALKASQLDDSLFNI